MLPAFEDEPEQRLEGMVEKVPIAIFFRGKLGFGSITKTLQAIPGPVLVMGAYPSSSLRAST